MKKTPYQAPNFTLLDNDGNSHSLKDYLGKWLVLYFYPKDNSPGCTIEACSIRDVRDDIVALGAEVVGISRDSASSHNDFKSKFHLNFTLLIDPDHLVMDEYDVWDEKGFGWGKVLRTTFIINPIGQVVKVYEHVTPLGHGRQIIDDLKKLIG